MQQCGRDMAITAICGGGRTGIRRIFLVGHLLRISRVLPALDEIRQRPIIRDSKDMKSGASSPKGYQDLP